MILVLLHQDSRFLLSMAWQLYAESKSDKEESTHIASSHEECPWYLLQHILPPAPYWSLRLQVLLDDDVWDLGSLFFWLHAVYLLLGSMVNNIYKMMKRRIFCTNMQSFIFMFVSNIIKKLLRHFQKCEVVQPS